MAGQFPTSPVASDAQIGSEQNTIVSVTTSGRVQTRQIDGQKFTIIPPVVSNAQGGAVSKDKPILVGENGPEIFRPNSTGQIEQNARGFGMGGASTVNINVSATDVKGVKELLIDNRSTIVNAVNIALNEKGKEALV